MPAIAAAAAAAAQAAYKGLEAVKWSVRKIAPLSHYWIVISRTDLPAKKLDDVTAVAGDGIRPLGVGMTAAEWTAPCWC